MRVLKPRNKTMNYQSLSFFLGVLLISFSLSAEVPRGYLSDKGPGEYDEILECIVNIEGICETEYVEEVLELCKDCEIPTPHVEPPSALRVWATKWGISLFYAMNGDKEWVSQKVFGSKEEPQE